MEEIPISGYINQLTQILLPVSKGLGFTVLPKSTLDNFAEKETITVHQLTQEITKNVYLIWQKHRNWPARFMTIRDTLKQCLS